MKSNSLKHLSVWTRRGALAACLIQPLFGGSLLQPAHFAADNEASPYVGSGNQNLVDPGFFSAAFDPFPAYLGTLTSYTVRCEINGRLSGAVEQEASSGNASGGLGGTFSIGGSAFNGTGGSNGTGAGPGGPLEVDFGIPDFEQTLSVSNAGVTYDPAILASVTGDSPFTVMYNSAVMVGYANVSSLNANVTGTISLTYHYLDAASNAPASITITKIIRDSSSGDVSLEWTSDAGRSYAVDASANLSDWTVIDAVIGGQPLTQYVEPGVSAIQPRRFYRIRERD